MIPQTTVEIIQLESGQICRQENGIICFHMKDELSVTLEIVHEAVLAIKTLDDSGARLIIKMGLNTDVEFAAQRYFATNIGVEKLALIAQNRIQVEVARFLVTMMKLFHCPYDIKSFYTLEQAEKWLLED